MNDNEIVANQEVRNMNRKIVNQVERDARQHCERVEVMGIADTNRFALSVDGFIFYDADSFYEKYPQAYTPYKVQKVADQGWKIVKVESVDEQKFRDIDGSKLYPQRQGANRRCKQLNDEWHAKFDQAYHVELSFC